jgi:hypothetical protein
MAAASLLDKQTAGASRATVGGRARCWRPAFLPAADLLNASRGAGDALARRHYCRHASG